MTTTSQFFDMKRHRQFFLTFFFLFLLSNLVTGPSFMSKSSPVLELWQSGNQISGNPEIPPSEVFPIFRDWGELRIPNLARMSQIKCYLMIQNAKVIAFTVSQLLRENQ